MVGGHLLARSGALSYTVSAWPARAMQPAMGAPIAPTPTNATFMACSRLAREDLGGGIEGFDTAGHARVHSGVQDGLADLLDAAAIGQRAGDVHLELIGLGQRSQRRQRDQAAGLAIQSRPVQVSPKQ